LNGLSGPIGIDFYPINLPAAKFATEPFEVAIDRWAMDTPWLELPQGALDLLILKTLVLEPMHGWAISERLQQISEDALQIGQRSLYPALHWLERRGWIKATWGASDNIGVAKTRVCAIFGRRPDVS
jgi:hypothetical protein